TPITSQAPPVKLALPPPAQKEQQLPLPTDDVWTKDRLQQEGTMDWRTRVRKGSASHIAGKSTVWRDQTWGFAIQLPDRCEFKNGEFGELLTATIAGGS